MAPTAAEQRWGEGGGGAGEELFAAMLQDGTTGTLLGSSLSLDESLKTTIGVSRSRVHDTLILTL